MENPVDSASLFVSFCSEHAKSKRAVLVLGSREAPLSVLVGLGLRVPGRDRSWWHLVLLRPPSVWDLEEIRAADPPVLIHLD